MSQRAGKRAGEGHEIEVTRTYDAPRELVFDAWTKPEHLKHWFAPAPLTVSEVESDPTEGGPYRLAMRFPDGQVSWSEGTYREVVPPGRVVLAQAVLGPDDQPLFEVITTVTLKDDGGKTTITVHERVERIFDDAAAGLLSGMEQGLHMVLDNLTEYLTKLGTRPGGDA
jgi:uncharacterized protein YndB with AHSA1/START domain